MTNLPTFMMTESQRRAAAEAEAVCESLTDGLELPPADGAPGGYDTLPYLPSDPYGGPGLWAPGGNYYWSRVFSAACAEDIEAVKLLASKWRPRITLNRCIIQAKNIPIERKKEVIGCLIMALDTFQS